MAKKTKSEMGYRDDSPYRDEPYIDINTPTGLIDMSNTGIPLMANGVYLPPYSGMYQFEPGIVREEPIDYEEIELTDEEIEEYRKGGYIVEELDTAQKGKTLPPKYVQSASDPRYRAYQDSLSLYDISRQKEFFLDDPQKTTEAGYDQARSWGQDLPHWSFDEVQYERDKAVGKVKDFDAYMYDIHDTKGKQAYERNIGSRYKYLDKPKEVKLKDGRIKRYWEMYREDANSPFKIAKEYYDIYDPVTGSVANYTQWEGEKPHLHFINHPYISPYKTDYYRHPGPEIVNEYTLSKMNEERIDDKIVAKSSSNKKYINKDWLAQAFDRYKKPVQPYIIDPKRGKPYTGPANIFKAQGLTPRSKKPKGTTDPKLSVAVNLRKRGMDSSFAARKKLAEEAGITDYKGTKEQNIALNEYVFTNYEGDKKKESKVEPGNKPKMEGPDVPPLATLKGIRETVATPDPEAPEEIKRKMATGKPPRTRLVPETYITYGPEGKIQLKAQRREVIPKDEVEEVAAAPEEYQNGGIPKDYQQFLDFSTTAPENRQPGADWEYGNPRQYDHYGMWDALGKPKDFEEALEMNPDWQPDPYDNMYHGYSVNPNTGVWLKPHVPGEEEPGSTAWMEYAGYHLNPELYNNFSVVYDPELQRMKGVERKQEGSEVKYNTPAYNEAYEQGTVTRYNPQTGVYQAPDLPEFTVKPKMSFMDELDLIGHTTMNFMGEAAGVLPAMRIADDPVGTARGTAQTIADLAMYSNPGSAMYAQMSDVNPITGQPYWGGLDQALDVVSVIPEIGPAAKALRLGNVGKFFKGLKGSPNNMTTLYRIQEKNAKTFAKLAEEGKIPKAFNNKEVLARKANEEKYFGEWFTKDKSDLDWYKRDREFKDPEIIELNVPNSELSKFQNYDKSLSRAPDREFVVPLDLQNQYTKGLKNSPRYGISPEEAAKHRDFGKVMEKYEDIKNIYRREMLYAKEIEDVNELQKVFAQKYSGPDMERRFGHMGVLPKDMPKKPPKVAFETDPKGLGSHYDTSKETITINLPQIKKLQDEGIMLDVKNIYEHELGHYFQDIATRQHPEFKKVMGEYEDALDEYETLLSEGSLGKLKDYGLTKPVKPTYGVLPTVFDKYAHTIQPTAELKEITQLIAPENAIGRVSRMDADLQTAVKRFNYFNQKAEPYAHIREMRQSMIDRGYLKGIEDKVTNEKLMNFIADNPTDRISTFISPTEKNLNKLRQIMNSAPAAVPGAVGAGILLNQERDGGEILELTDEEIEEYRKGGYIVEEYQDGEEVKYDTPEYRKAYEEGTVTRYNPETDTYQAPNLPEFEVRPRSFMDEMDQIGHTAMNFLGETSGFLPMTRIVDDPVGHAIGTGQTVADLAMYSNQGSAMYAAMSDVNPITNRPYWEGVDQALDVAAVIPELGAGVKALGIGRRSLKGLKALPKGANTVPLREPKWTIYDAMGVPKDELTRVKTARELADYKLKDAPTSEYIKRFISERDALKYDEDLLENLNEAKLLNKDISKVIMEETGLTLPEYNAAIKMTDEDIFKSVVGKPIDFEGMRYKGKGFWGKPGKDEDIYKEQFKTDLPEIMGGDFYGMDYLTGSDLKRILKQQNPFRKLDYSKPLPIRDKDFFNTMIFRGDNYGQTFAKQKYNEAVTRRAKKAAEIEADLELMRNVRSKEGLSDLLDRPFWMGQNKYGGEIMDLTDKEIEELRAQGYEVDEL